MRRAQKPKLAVWKFSSCDGCQLCILDCEDELLAIANAVEIAVFPEATRAKSAGPYDISLVEGSISTPDDVLRIAQVRKQSKILVAIGACATSGGIQALRNFAHLGDYSSGVYARPEWIEALEKSTPIRDHVKVDAELRGCPISKSQLLELVSAMLAGRRPNLQVGSVCLECKQRQTGCLMVAKGIPCLGPVTHAGCGGLCPSYDRGCYGCFGPCAGANLKAMIKDLDRLGVPRERQILMLRQINANAEAFREAADELLGAGA